MKHEGTQMTFHDLRHALTEALATGKIGTPVALRVHVRLGDPGTDLTAPVAAVAELAENLLSCRPATLNSRRDSGDRQLNVLVRCERGETVLVTVVRGASSTLDLLAIGNHGLVRLEGADLFDETSLPSTDKDRWTGWIPSERGM